MNSVDRPPSAPASPPRRRRLLLAAIPFLAGVLLLTPPGWCLLAALAPMLSGGQMRIESPSGSLWEEFGVAQVRWTGGDGLRVEADGLRVRWSLAELLRGRVAIDHVEATRIRVVPGTTGDARMAPPESLATSWPVRVAALHVGRLQIDSETPVRIDAVKARLDFAIGGHHLSVGRAAVAVGDTVAEVSGDLRIASARPFALAFDIQATGQVGPAPGRASLQCDGSLLAPACRFGFSSRYGAGTGEVDGHPFAAWPLARGVLHVVDLDPARWSGRGPSARLTLHADLAPAGERAGRVGERPVLNGSVSITNATPGAWSAGYWPLAGARAGFELAGDTLTLAPLVIRLAGGGQLTGEGSMNWRDPVAALAADLSVADVDLAALHAAAPSTRIAGRVAARPLSGASNPAWQLDVRLDDRHRRRIGMTLMARVDPSGLTVERGDVRGLGAVSSLTGQIGFAVPQHIDLSGQVHHFDPAAFGTLPAGAIDMNWQVRGALRGQPALAVTAKSGSRTHWLGLPLQVDVAATWSDGVLNIARGELDVGGNRLSAAGQFGAADGVLSVTLAAVRLDRLAPALSSWLGVPVAGSLSGEVTLSGRLDDPVGQVDLRGERLQYGAWTLAGLTLHGQRVAARHGQLVLSATKLTQAVSDAPPRLLAGNLVAEITGTPHRHRAEASLSTPVGNVRLAATGARGLNHRWTGTLEEFTVSSSDGGRLDGSLVVPAGLWAIRQASGIDLGMDALHWRGAPGEVRVDTLRRESGRWSSQGQWLALPLRSLLDGFAAPPVWRSASGDLRVRMDWALNLGEQPEGRFSLRRQDGDGRFPGAAERPLTIDQLTFALTLAGLRVRLEAGVVAAALGLARVEAEVGVTRAASGWGLAPEGTIQGQGSLSIPRLADLGAFFGPVVQWTGRLDATATLAGTAARPQWRGQVRGVDLGIVWRDEGIQLRDGQLLADLDERALQVRHLRFKGVAAAPPKRLPLPGWVAEGGGAAELSGEIAWRDQRGHLDFRAERFALLQRPDLWLIASGTARAVLVPEQAVVATGRVRIDAAAIQIAAAAPPRLDDDVIVLGGPQRAARATVPLDAALEVDFGDAFHFSGRGLSGRIAGRLTLSQRPNAPAPRAIGVLELQSGRFDAYGQMLDVERGIVNFQGALDNPGLNVLALRPGLPVIAGVRVTGSIRRPRVALYSEAPMSDAEKLSWVVLGRGGEEHAGAEAATLMAAASALLQGAGDGPVRRIADALGFDDVQLGDRDRSAGLVSGSRVATGSGAAAPDTPADQVLVVSKRLSSSTTLAFEQTLSGVGTVLRLTRQFSRSLSVTARTGAENALSIHWGKSFR